MEVNTCIDRIKSYCKKANFIFQLHNCGRKVIDVNSLRNNTVILVIDANEKGRETFAHVICYLVYKGKLFFADPGGESPSYYPVNSEHWLPDAPNIIRKDIQADHRTCGLFNDLIIRLFTTGLSPRYIATFFNKNSISINHSIIRQYQQHYNIKFDFHRRRVDKDFIPSSKATKIFNRICKRVGPPAKRGPSFKAARTKQQRRH